VVTKGDPFLAISSRLNAHCDRKKQIPRCAQNDGLTATQIPMLMHELNAGADAGVDSALSP
jgi:hypothetical protein